MGRDGEDTHVRWFRVMRRALLLAVVLIAVAACASKGLPPAQRVANSAPQQGSSSDGGGDGATQDGPADPDAAKKQISDLVVYIFDGKNTEIEAKLALVSHPETIRDSLLKALAANKATFDALSAQVQSIEFKSPTEAVVTFTLLVSGQPTLEGFQGTVKFEDGKWKLAPQTMCDLVALADSTLPCNPGGV